MHTASSSLWTSGSWGGISVATASSLQAAERYCLRRIYGRRRREGETPAQHISRATHAVEQIRDDLGCQPLLVSIFRRVHRRSRHQLRSPYKCWESQTRHHTWAAWWSDRSAWGKSVDPNNRYGWRHSSKAVWRSADHWLSLYYGLDWFILPASREECKKGETDFVRFVLEQIRVQATAWVSDPQSEEGALLAKLVEAQLQQGPDALHAPQIRNEVGLFLQRCFMHDTPLPKVLPLEAFRNVRLLLCCSNSRWVDMANGRFSKSTPWMVDQHEIVVLLHSLVREHKIQQGVNANGFFKAIANMRIDQHNGRRTGLASRRIALAFFRTAIPFRSCLPLWTASANAPWWEPPLHRVKEVGLHALSNGWSDSETTRKRVPWLKERCLWTCMTTMAVWTTWQHVSHFCVYLNFSTQCAGLCLRWLAAHRG
eukprot:TRINITY_DN24976_c0_g1_i1.p1 TRINITY_DN24976_c0_g1~~TRINITY_DN24976_c0_g1_i1.p1  ORF type:complete len:426 (+),score=-1.49 TRINITY_DN24976_c0_g1_i1:279-1556(+)